MSSHRLRYAAGAAAIACALSGAPTLAQDAPPDNADAILVTAARLEDRELRILSTPSFGVGVSEAQIEAVNAFNVEDTFKFAPNLIVRKRFAGDNNATLAFRGSHNFQTPRALVSVDGFTISNFLGASFDTAPKWGVVAPGDVERVEIVYGPTSARYSGNSLGGTLLLKTRDVTENAARLRTQVFRQDFDYYDTDLSLYGWSVDGGLDFVLGDRATLSLSYRHFENEGQPQQWRRLVGGSERQALIDAGVVDAAYFDQAIQDPELPFLRIASEDSVVRSTEDQFRVRGTYDLGGGWTARGLLALLVDEEDASRPDSFLVDETGAQSFIGIAGVRQGISNDTELLLGVGLSGEAAGWAVDVSLSRFDVLRARDRQSDNFDTTTGLAPLTGQVTDGDNTSWNSLETIAERQLGAHALAAGFSYAGYSFDTPRFTTLNWRTAERAGLLDASGGETRLYGLFLEDAITLSGQWTLTLGVRAEAWEAEDGFLQTAAERVDYASRSDEAFSPKGALTFRPAPDWSFTASAALATRFPTVQELFQPALISFGPNVGDLDFGTFDPELKPEEALDIQFTIEKTFERAFFAVSLFRQDVDDTIFAQTVPELGTSLLTNIDNVTTNGIDFVAATEDLFIDGLAIDANLSLLDAEIKENAIDPSLVGNRFPRIPDLRANASIRYEPTEDWLFALGWRYQDTPDRNIENSSTSRCSTFFCVSNFSFVDVKATRRFSDVAVSLGVDNVADDRAFVFHPYPGRTFLLEVAWDGGF